MFFARPKTCIDSKQNFGWLTFETSAGSKNYLWYLWFEAEVCICLILEIGSVGVIRRHRSRPDCPDPLDCSSSVIDRPILRHPATKRKHFKITIFEEFFLDFNTLQKRWHFFIAVKVFFKWNNVSKNFL